MNKIGNIHNRRPIAPGRHQVRTGRLQLGFTLTELMVAAALGAVIIAGQLAVYLHATKAHNSLFRLNQEMENGRYAIQLMREDLWHAGFWGEYVPTMAPTAAAPLCAAFDTWTAGDVLNFISLPVYGYDNGADLPGDCTMVTDRVAGTDVLVVRHADTCIADAGTDNNCADLAENTLYLQVSLCGSDPSPFVLDSDPDDSDQDPFTLLQKDASGKNCQTPLYTITYADRRKILSHLYYIKDVDGTPTLMRSEIVYIPGPTPGSGHIQQGTPIALVEGVEYMEIEYGIDSDTNGSPDSFTTAPATIGDWASVVAIKLHLLTRTLEETPGYTDDKTYRLGTTTLGPLNDGYYRRVLSAFIRLHNPAGRREKS